MRKTRIFQESINLDEVASNFRDGLNFVVQNNVPAVEIRTINDRNILYLSEKETRVVANAIKKYGKQVSAIASPLFKWHAKRDKPTKQTESFDSFGVAPNVKETAKKQYIDHIINQALILGTSQIRVFSGLRTKNNNHIMRETEVDLMRYALKKAKVKGLKLLLENEPSCVIADFNDYLRTLKTFQKDGLVAWVDIANFYEIGQRVNSEMLRQLSPFIEYIHIKDPIGISQHSYLPVGDGYINYKRIFSDLENILKRPTYFSIETHVKTGKTEASQESLSYVRSLISYPRKKYAIIGAGRISPKHAIACKRSLSSELRGVFDINPNRMEDLAIEHDCQIYLSLKDLLADPQVDVISICTPNNTHLEIAKKVVNSGKIALCEKPFSINPRRLKKYATNQRFNHNTYIAFQKKFNLAARRYLHYVRSGNLGKISSFSIKINWWRDLDYFNDWHGDEKTSGGPLFMQAIHAIDLLGMATDLTLDSASGYVYKSRAKLTSPDIVLAVVRLKNGVVGQIEVNLAAFGKNIEESLFIVGTNGSIKVGGVGLSEDNHIQTLASGCLPQKYFDGNRLDYFGGGHTQLINTLSNQLLNIPDKNVSLLVHPRDIIKIIGFIKSVYDALTRV